MEGAQLAQMLLRLLQHKEENRTHLQQLLDQHADAPIFRSLPGAGPFLAPALLVKFGENRERFASPSALQSLAGTCPVTIQSGRSRSVRFRRACDRQFRHIAQLHARASLAAADWADAYYQDTLQRTGSANQALRCLANRWLKIAWTLWQRRTTYDPSIHLRNICRHRTRL